MDTNNDGKVTRDELRARLKLVMSRAPGAAVTEAGINEMMEEEKEQFETQDKNGDGRVTMEELLAGLDAVRPLGAKDSWSREIKAVYHKTFERADANQDGELTLRERVLGFVSVDGEAADDAVQMMRIFDDNGDGFLTVEELARSVPDDIAEWEFGRSTHPSHMFESASKLKSEL